jgi:tRNA (mo5U34)-methyltransferase
MDDAELQRRVDAHIWFHAIRFRPGVAAPGTKPESILNAEAEALFAGVALEGRSVLDIGAWNGHFSFEAKRRGAGRVLATDSFTWNHAHYRGRETIELGRAEFGLDIELRELEPTRIGPDLGGFDVALFLGVFYHLLDPIAVLRRVRGVTRSLLLLETHQDAEDSERPQMVFYPGATLAQDHTNWWGPNIACMNELLRALGFVRVFYRPHPVVESRGLYAAWTDAIASPLTAGIPGAGWTDLDEPGAIRALLRRE